MVSELVRQDVGLGEIARRTDVPTQDPEELEIDVDPQVDGQ
jgi:hypothetical protein